MRDYEHFSGNGLYDGGGETPASTLACLLRYGQSDNVSERFVSFIQQYANCFYRQVAVRHLVKTLRSLETGGQIENIEQVFALIQERFLDDTGMFRLNHIET